MRRAPAGRHKDLNLPKVQSAPHPYDVDDLHPGRMIAVTEVGTRGAVAWIRPADSGRQWLITGDAKVAKTTGRLIRARCRVHQGWTNWAWVRGPLDQQLRERGYGLATLAVGTGARTDGRIRESSLRGTRLAPGEAAVLVDGAQLFIHEVPASGPGHGLAA